MSALTRTMTHTCTIQVNSPAQNEIGELVASWADTAVSQACRFSENSKARGAASLERSSRLSAAITATYLLLLPPGVTVAEKTYRVTNIVTEDATYAGPFEVAEVVNRRDKGGIRAIAVGLERTEKS